MTAEVVEETQPRPVGRAATLAALSPERAASPLGLGLAGIWLAIVVDYAVRAGLMAFRFSGGRWQRLVY